MKINFNKILVGFDHSPSSTVALEKGIQIAEKTGAEIHVVYVEGPGHFLDWDSVHDYLDELRAKRGVTIHLHHKNGRAFKEIHHVEKEIGADLIVIGTHSHSGFMPLWIGSTAFRVVSASKCPVITVQESAANLDFRNIIVPLENLPESRQKVTPAADFAKLFGSTVHVLCVSKDKDTDTENHLHVYCNQACDVFDSKGVPYTRDMRLGTAIAPTVIEYSKEHNGGIIFMMTETESAGIFMGTVAQQLINQSPVPVMAIHNIHVTGVAGSGY